MASPCFAIAGCLEEGCSVEEIENIQHKLERDEGARGSNFYPSTLNPEKVGQFLVESNLSPPYLGECN